MSPRDKERIRNYIIKNRDTDPRLSQYKDMTVEELEELVDLLDYETPLYGELLKTGDEIPLYPFIFAGVGMLILLFAIFRKRII